jgi:hypothetical protein
MFTAKVKGKEQLILLPVDQKTFTVSDGAKSVDFATGRQAIVLSGYAEITGGGVFVAPPQGDDDPLVVDVQMAVGPKWIDVVQASATVIVSEIISLDTDEVDASAWGVTECTWASPAPTPTGTFCSNASSSSAERVTGSALLPTTWWPPARSRGFRPSASSRFTWDESGGYPPLSGGPTAATLGVVRANQFDLSSYTDGGR